jgi:hypothetical protein
MIAKQLILRVLILASGCATEQSKWKFSPGTAQEGVEGANPKEWVKNATEMSEDLKHLVIEGKLTLTEATRLEKERRSERTREIQSTLNLIKKEVREEYAASRPAKIKSSILKEQLCLGMDDKDVLVCLGQPERKTHAVTRSGLVENWAYKRLTVWFEDGLVISWREEE